MTTEQKYNLYEQLLIEWNQKINLVAKSTLIDIRTRHINDSAQLADYIPKDKTVIDLGSGAGFPAVVLAILGYRVFAVESIGKKCRFLEMLAEKLDLPNLTVVNGRIPDVISSILSAAAQHGGYRLPRLRGGKESAWRSGAEPSDSWVGITQEKHALPHPRHTSKDPTPPPKPENFVFTARAFAPLYRILDWTAKFKIPYVLLKGQGAENEIDAARGNHRFEATTAPSRFGDGHIIKLTTR